MLPLPRRRGGPPAGRPPTPFEARRVHFVLPGCEHYSEASCTRGGFEEDPPRGEYSCNELWCEKKVERVDERLARKG